MPLMMIFLASADVSYDARSLCYQAGVDIAAAIDAPDQFIFPAIIERRQMP